jgi:hypothetical protein
MKDLLVGVDIGGAFNDRALLAGSAITGGNTPSLDGIRGC